MEFQSNRTPDYDAAVNALKKLDWDSKTRAFAEVSQPDLEAAATKEWGRRSKKLSWRPIIDLTPQDGDSLPGDDHIELRIGDKSLTQKPTSPNHRLPLTAFETHSGRSIFAAGTALPAPKPTFAPIEIERLSRVNFGHSRFALPVMPRRQSGHMLPEGMPPPRRLFQRYRWQAGG